LFLYRRRRAEHDEVERHPLRTPTPANPRFLHEPVVVAHDELRLDLLHGVHRHADDDQERRAAEEKRDAGALGDEMRQVRVEPVADDGDRRNTESRSAETLARMATIARYTAPASVILARIMSIYSAVRFPAESRNEPAVLPHVLGDVVRIEDDRRVEVREEMIPVT